MYSINVDFTHPRLLTDLPIHGISLPVKTINTAMVGHGRSSEWIEPPRGSIRVGPRKARPAPRLSVISRGRCGKHVARFSYERRMRGDGTTRMIERIALAGMRGWNDVAEDTAW